MSVGSFSEWKKLPVGLAELCINTTLRCGQSFRWQQSAENEWSCVLLGRVITLRQDDTHIHYKTLFPSPGALPTPNSSMTPRETPEKDDTASLISYYFNLDVDLTKLYEEWSIADPNFKRKALQFTGIRILRQDAWEALISFICSSNNNIARISQMVEKLCLNYGPLIGHIGVKPYHDFPRPSDLAKDGVETRLRELGFGYRAKYIYKTASIIANRREAGWLNSLRNPESPVFGKVPGCAGEMGAGGRQGYREAHDKLLELQGVGPKVADCVCLMGLGWGEAVPVDTHVWQIAQRDYKFGRGKQKSLTKDTYDAVGDHFRKLWGKQAGWAHSVLFTADLRVFAERLTTKSEGVNGGNSRKIKEELDDESVTKTSLVSQQTTVKREVSNEAEGKRSLEQEAQSTTTKRRRTRRNP